MTLSIQAKARFLRLACDLSPENLYADGERGETEARALKRKITADWRALEAEVGQEVTQGQAFNWADEVRRHEDAERRAAIAALPSNPLVQSKNKGVWSREGQNGMSAYYIWGPERGLGDTRYTLFSEFAYRLVGDKEELGKFDSLDEAVAFGEAFLATVTYETIKARNPLYRPENIKRELGRLPVGYDADIPAMPPVTSFTMRFGSGEKTVTYEKVAPDDVAVILAKHLVERDQFCSITSA